MTQPQPQGALAPATPAPGATPTPPKPRSVSQAVGQIVGVVFVMFSVSVSAGTCAAVAYWTFLWVLSKLPR